MLAYPLRIVAAFVSALLAMAPAVAASTTPSRPAVSRRNASSDRRSSGNPPWRATACATVRRSQGGVKSTVSPW